MIITWSTGLADENMDEGILVDLGAIVARHPWWHARARLTLAFLEKYQVHVPAEILDAGCGWGVTLKALEGRGYHAIGMDISRMTLEKLDSPGRQLIEADLTKPLPDGHPTYDAVLALDVIEHIDDDRAAVATLSELIKPGGLLILSVPALPEFFTEFDQIQGHRRRYTPETLARSLDSSPLRVEQISWWGEWLVPILKKQRGQTRAKPGDSPTDVYKKYLKLPPWPAPLLLSAGFAWEHKRALAGTLTTGTSLLAVARRV